MNSSKSFVEVVWSFCTSADMIDFNFEYYLRCMQTRKRGPGHERWLPARSKKIEPLVFAHWECTDGRDNFSNWKRASIGNAKFFTNSFHLSTAWLLLSLFYFIFMAPLCNRWLWYWFSLTTFTVYIFTGNVARGTRKLFFFLQSNIINSITTKNVPSYRCVSFLSIDTFISHVIYIYTYVHK